MAVAGEAGKEEEEPHCDVMEALTGCWGVGRANLVVWRDGAGQNCQRVASVEEERAGEKKGEVTRYSNEMPGEMKTKQNQENNKPPKQSHPFTKLNVSFFFFWQRNKQSPPPKLPVREAVQRKVEEGTAQATWGRKGGGQGLWTSTDAESGAQALPAPPPPESGHHHHNE